MPAKLLSLQPDLDPTTPGIVTDCNFVVPSVRGLKAAASPVKASVGPLSGQCLGAAVLAKLAGTTRVIAGTSTHLYEGGATAWSDVTRAAGVYSAVTGRWRFAQYGDISIAA